MAASLKRQCCSAAAANKRWYEQVEGDAQTLVLQSAGAWRLHEARERRERPILKIGCSISVCLSSSWASFIIICNHLSSFVIMYQNHVSYNIIILCHHHFRQIKVRMCLVKLRYITRTPGDVNPQGGVFVGTKRNALCPRGGWGYANVPWTCTHGWMLCNRCWSNGDNVSSICTTVCCHTPWMQTLTSEAGETWERGNGGTGAVLRAFYRTLVLIKPKAIEISVNKLSARVLMSGISKLVNYSSLAVSRESAAWGFTQPKTWMMRCLLAALLRFCSLTSVREKNEKNVNSFWNSSSFDCFKRFS